MTPSICFLVCIVASDSKMGTKQLFPPSKLNTQGTALNCVHFEHCSIKVSRDKKCFSISGSNLSE